MSPFSRVLSTFFALIIVLFFLINTTTISTSFFTYTSVFSHFLATFHGKNNHHYSSNDQTDQPNLSLRRSTWRNPFIAFKGINDISPSSVFTKKNISRAISPDIAKCGPVELPPNAITLPYCCPILPSPLKIIDFKEFAKPNAPLRVRKPIHLLDDEYMAKLEKGIAIMKSLPENDPRNYIQQAKVHCVYCNGGYPQKPPFQNLKIDIHRSWLFYPFHRWYIYFFERILGNLIGDPNFAVPYWSWDSIEGMQMPKYFANPNSSLYHHLRDPRHLPPYIVDLNYHVNAESTTQDQQVKYNLAFMYKQMVLADTKEVFMGGVYRHGDQAQPAIGSVELAPHNTVHKWVGRADLPSQEDMGTFYTAARDPIFYPHHSNLDRLWGIWTSLDGGRKDYRDDQDWLDSEFFFYDENLNLVRVNIRDSLDTKKLGYVYEEVELPWLNASPKPSRSKLQRQEKKASLLASSQDPMTTTITKFPLVLDSKVSVVVNRPKKLRSKLEKEREEEVLVMEIIDLHSDKDVKFDVHVDDDEEMLSGPDKAEFVGTFTSVPHGSHKSKTKYLVAISKVLEILEAEEDENIVVTLAPIVGKGLVSIGSIMVEYIPK
ncbi:polyphenol oxidase I, chloroplastic-like [Arachis stenosperma]|uniref:polyphenol oxidase I, chloroplastic-like n=1 Tax=Arachis stenosperma TaxID=217475 RepID=UPI0025AD45F2|nr:polyphenol oxidase I, chloroplastic-like [Arachis stenosperma]XP_057755005.1 polyphenol oxidase I, chloroplastic-like [Arachis stenosperma]